MFYSYRQYIQSKCSLVNSPWYYRNEFWANSITIYDIIYPRWTHGTVSSLKRPYYPWMWGHLHQRRNRAFKVRVPKLKYYRIYSDKQVFQLREKKFADNNATGEHLLSLVKYCIECNDYNYLFFLLCIFCVLPHWGRDKMSAICQTTLSHACCWSS